MAGASSAIMETLNKLRPKKDQHGIVDQISAKPDTDSVIDDVTYRSRSVLKFN